MFKLNFFVDDRDMAAVLHALSGKAKDLQFQSVTNAKSTKHGVVAATRAGNMIELFTAAVKASKAKTLTRADADLFCTKNGWSATSGGHVLKEALKSGLLKKHGKVGNSVSYTVQK